MAKRIRADGRILCAAMHPAEDGDTYIDDGLSYRLSVDLRVLVTEPMHLPDGVVRGGHATHGEWWWRNEVPADAVIESFEDDGPRAHPQDDVREFHEALGIPIGDTPAIRRGELRASLIEEEAREAIGAIRSGDLVGAIDGLCDLVCVVYGAALEFGIDLAPFWREVHRSNMAKAGGPVREDGKVLKPEGWVPPDIAGVLAAIAPPPPCPRCEDRGWYMGHENECHESGVCRCSGVQVECGCGA